MQPAQTGTLELPSRGAWHSRHSEGKSVAIAKSALLRSTREIARQAVAAESGFAMLRLLKTHLTRRAFA
jgi:hypothetical protein